MARRHKDHKPKPHHKHHHKKHHHKKGGGNGDGSGSGTGPGSGSGDGTTTEDLKESSTQSGQDAMDATPSSMPDAAAFDDSVYSTGPGEAVQYNYVRVDGGNEQYALQQSQYTAPVPPISGFGQILTPGAAQQGAMGAANNPT